MQRQFENQSLADLVEQRIDKVAGDKDPRIPYVGLEHIAQEMPALVGTSPGNISTSVNSTFQSGDILFGKLRPNLRKSLQANFTGQFFCTIAAIGSIPSEIIKRQFDVFLNGQLRDQIETLKYKTNIS